MCIPCIIIYRNVNFVNNKEKMKMKITVKNNYLIFPVNTLTKNKKLTFKNGDKTLYSLDIKIDYFNPDFYAYIDVSRFMGQTLDISVDPQIKLDFRIADDMDIDNLYREPMRPQVHYTTKNGWINDPNGLIYLDGTYHMFYQYNPAEPHWGNMHWGHATSTDLIHWKEEKTALFPDDRGAMFSGSAISDEKNLLGKNTGNKKAGLLYYTTTSPFSQRLSYSTDGFQTIEKYSDDPVIPHIEDENRDPKVIFCDEIDCYILALYLKNDIYAIFKSDDLVNWVELQRLSLPGDNECPDIFPLTDSEGTRKWIFSGAHGRYLVGNFKNGKFEPEQEAISQHYGNLYASQTFSNLPNGRIVQIAWDRWYLPSCGFNGQMGIPVELSLKINENTYYLEARPIKEIEALYNSFENYENIRTSHDTDFQVRLDDTAYLFKIDGLSNVCGVTKMQIFGRTVQFDFNKNEITVGKNFAPISLTESQSEIIIIVDRCSMEIFADDGKIYMSCIDKDTFCDRNMPYLVIKSENETVIKNMEIHSMKSIWG